jgi:hypothetical protein
MIDPHDLDPQREVLLVARVPDGPAFRTQAGVLRRLVDEGLLEATPTR